VRTAGAAAPRAASDRISDVIWGDGRRQGVAETVAKSMLRSASSQLGSRAGRALVRGVLGSLLK
jgi:hypothetical protein